MDNEEAIKHIENEINYISSSIHYSKKEIETCEALRMGIDALKSKRDQEVKRMRYVHNVYKVYNKEGEKVFRGSVPEIADHFYITKEMVYAVAEGKYKRFLKQYSLEYDGEESYRK